MKSYEALSIDVITVEDVNIASNAAESSYAYGTGKDTWNFLNDEGLGN